MPIPVGVKLMAALGLAALPLLGNAAFSFSLPSTGDTPVRSADFRGRPIALVLWASWSPPSRLLARTLVDLRGKPGFEGIAFVGVHFESGTPEDRLAAVRRFAAEQRINFPLALGDEEFRKRVKGVRGYPTVLLLDAEHRPAGRVAGFDGKPEGRLELENRLRALLPDGGKRG
ncbi:MAG TPA: TlpA disulfide reductase family protein [Planctomycetota bacterium]|nr:TlpA disulfide reductase family protein [Planctomycetota bacterium]